MSFLGLTFLEIPFYSKGNVNVKLFFFLIQFSLSYEDYACTLQRWGNKASLPWHW